MWGSCRGKGEGGRGKVSVIVPDFSTVKQCFVGNMDMARFPPIPRICPLVHEKERNTHILPPTMIAFQILGFITIVFPATYNIIL
jgi:hypothetical protein